MPNQPQTEPQNQIDSRPLSPLIREPGPFFMLLALWFAAQVLLRVVISGTANLDEAEQLMLTQDWALGYGPQPPLYTWLQGALFGVMGVSIFSLALLKNGLLFCTYSLAYLNARQLSRRHEIGVVAALSVFLIPQIAWESQRDLTHSVLASTLALATLFCVLKSHEHRTKLGWFALLGIALGCGALAKYNFALWAVGLLGAAVSMPAFRGLVLNRRMILSAVLAVMIVAPHATWALKHRDRVTQTASKFELAGSKPQGQEPVLSEQVVQFLRIRLEGVWSMLQSAMNFAVPLLVVHALLLWRRRAGLKQDPRVNEGAILILRAFGAVGLMLLAAILLFGATGFKDRWFQPILISLPVLLAVRLLPLWDTKALRRLWRVAMVIMTAVAILIPGRLVSARFTGREDRLNFPVPELGRTLAKQMDPAMVVLAETPFLAGNLRLVMPDHRVISRDWGDPGGAPCCIVWDAREQRDAPVDLVKRARHSLSPESQRMFVEAPIRHQPDRVYRLGARW